MSKKSNHCVVVGDKMVYGPCGKAKAQAKSEILYQSAIKQKLEEWGVDPDDCSVKRYREATLAVGMDGAMPEVMSVEAYEDEYCEDEED